MEIFSRGTVAQAYTAAILVRNTLAEVLCSVIWRWYDHKITLRSFLSLNLMTPEENQEVYLSSSKRRNRIPRIFPKKKVCLVGGGGGLWVLTGNIWRAPGTFHCDVQHDVHAWLSSSATVANVISQTTQQWLQRSPNFLKEKMTMQNAVTHVKIIKGTRVPPSGLGKYYLWWQKIAQKKKSHV